MKSFCLLLFTVLCVSVIGHRSSSDRFGASREENVYDKVEKYSLHLKPENDKFTGTLTLTFISDSIKKFLLKKNSDIVISECSYPVTGSEKPANCIVLKEEENSISYSVPDIKIKSAVLITYSGKYAIDGLYKEKFTGQDYYFANFARDGLRKVLPFSEEEASFIISLEKNVNNFKVIHNIESLTSSGKVQLSKIAFVAGTLEKISVPETSPLEYWGIKNDEVITKNSVTAVKNIMLKLQEMFKKPKIEDSKNVIEIVLPQSPNRDIRAKYLNTQRNRNFLLDDYIGAFWEQSIRMTLIQELSQQWFGNEFIANDKWLNAGISTFLSYYLLDKVQLDDVKDKKFFALDQFVVDEMQFRAFETDGFPSDVSLETFNSKNTFYDGILPDPILYSKGASIIKSLYGICNDEKFKAGLNSIMQLSVPSVTIENFAGAFKNCFTTEVQAKKFLESWHKYPGYPVVHVNLVDGKTGKLNLTQELFAWTEKTTSDYIWTFQIEYHTSNSIYNSVWMTDKNQNLEIKSEFDWIIFISRRNGYYRVNYDMKMWNAIISQLEKNHTAINEIGRAQIIDDIFSFARSAKNYSQPTPNYNMAFRLFNYLKKEKSYIPLKAAFNAIKFLDSALIGNSLYTQFRARVKDVVDNLYKIYPVTEQKSDHLEMLLVREVASWACRLGNENCTKSANKFFSDWIKGEQTRLNLSKVEDILLHTAISNNLDKWDLLFEKLKNEKKTLEILTFIDCLSYVKDYDRTNRLLQLAFKDNFKNYMFDIFSSVMNGNPGNLTAVLSNLEQHKTEISDYAMKKLVLFALRNLNKAAGEQLITFTKKFLPKNDELHTEVDLVVDTIKTWDKKKISNIQDTLTESGESRIKPFAFIITLSAVLPLVNYFLR